MNGHTRLAALLALAALALPASAKTYYVDAAAGDDANTGLSAAAAFATIQKAIDKAAAGSTILVAPGEYQAISTNNKKLTIKAVEGPENTVITAYRGEVEDGAWEEQWDDDREEWVDVWVPNGNMKPDYAPVAARLGAWGSQAVYSTVYTARYSDGAVVKYVGPGCDRYLSKLPKGWTVSEWDDNRWEPPEGVYEVSVRESGFVKTGTERVFKGGKNTVLEGFALENGPRAAWGGSLKYCVIRNTDNGRIDLKRDFETEFCIDSQWGVNAAVFQSSLSDCTIAGNTNTPISTAYYDSLGGFVHGCTLVRCTIGDNENIDVGDSTLFCTLLAGNAMKVDPDSGSTVGTLVWGSDLYNCTVACNPVGNYTMDVADWSWTTVPADENDEDAWEENGEWFKEIQIRGQRIQQETTEDDEDGWYNEADGKYYKSVFVPYENDTDGFETGPNVAVSWCNVYDSVIWGNVDGDGNPANIDLDQDALTGLPVASDYMNHAYYDEWDGAYYEFKPYCSMMNSLVEDFLVEQKGNKGRYKNSTGNITGDPLFIDPDNGDYRLAPNSPCKDAGADYTKKTGKYDLDSGARKVGKVDMGAYELQPQTAVPADYDGDGITDAAFYFAASGQWWIFPSGDPGTVRTHSLPDRNGVPCPAAYDGGAAEPAYFTAAAKEPEFVRVKADGTVVREPFGTKGATPVAAKLDGAKATFGVYTANAKKPEFSFLDNPLTRTFGAKASRPVVADFDADGKDDLGVYTATASKPAFSILQSREAYDTTKLFNGGPVALGAKGAIPCCADFDGDGRADFGTYLSNTKAPYFTRLPSSTKFRETWTLPMGSKGDAPVVGVYEEGKPATPAVWTGSVWKYLDSSYKDVSLLGE